MNFWLGGLGALSDPTAPSTLNPDLGKWFLFGSHSLVGGSQGSEMGSSWVVASLLNEMGITLVGLKWVLLVALLLG